MIRAKRLKIKGIYLLYRSLQAFGWPFVLLYFAWRGLQRRAYLHSLRERFGSLPATFRQTVPGAIWLHAVSVGEVTAATQIVAGLRQARPRSPVFVSVSTLAGYEIASQKLSGTARVFYAPVDYVSAVRRVLRTLRPALVIVMETEIWPNLYREAKRSGAGLLLISGRISDRAIGRYRALRWFFGGVLAQADLLLAQSEEMRRRLLSIGSPEQRTLVGGNLKYDVAPKTAAADSPVRRFIEGAGVRAVWIAASTMPPLKAGDPDEDDVVIEAFQRVAESEPGLLLVLAPRRPERFETAAQALARAGVPFVRRSGLTGQDRLSLPGVLLLDSIGELAGLFPLADVVFMGGTLATRGGHNLLEPAQHGRPIVSGPHMENFPEIAAEFRAARALVEVEDAAGLPAAIIDLLRNPERAAEFGRRGLQCAQARQGATALSLRHACEVFGRHVPAYRPAQPGFALLWLLSRLWILGSRWNRARGLARQRHLNIPVICVGNITAGGTGKTPMVLHLAGRLKEAGYRPGILTRGYGRHSPHAFEAASAGAHLPVEQSGDEPQIFLRSGVAPVGIGRDRWHVGGLLAREFGIGVAVLDDGFSHARLRRDLDIVLVDALEPAGRGYPLPLGRLREPLEALARADILVITRTEFGRVNEGAEFLLRRYNSRAPIFHASGHPVAWVSAATGECMPADRLPHARVAGFCGLGNPGYFWHMLEALGLTVAARVEFEDHHSYRPREVRFMGRQFRDEGVEAVVTTEKDMVNLCDDPGHLLEPLPLYWLRIGVALDREGEFLEAVKRVLDK